MCTGLETKKDFVQGIQTSNQEKNVAFKHLHEPLGNHRAPLKSLALRTSEREGGESETRKSLPTAPLHASQNSSCQKTNLVCFHFLDFRQFSLHSLLFLKAEGTLYSKCLALIVPCISLSQRGYL